MDRVAAGEFQHPVVRLGLSESCIEVGAEEPLAGPGAGQVDQLFVAAGRGGDEDGNAVVAPADP